MRAITHLWTGWTGVPPPPEAVWWDRGWALRLSYESVCVRNGHGLHCVLLPLGGP